MSQAAFPARLNDVQQRVLVRLLERCAEPTDFFGLFEVASTEEEKQMVVAVAEAAIREGLLVRAVTPRGFEFQASRPPMDGVDIDAVHRNPRWRREGA